MVHSVQCIFNLMVHSTQCIFSSIAHLIQCIFYLMGLIQYIFNPMFHSIQCFTGHSIPERITGNLRIEKASKLCPSGVRVDRGVENCLFVKPW